MRSLLCREGVIGPEPAVPSDQDARDSVQPARGPDATAASPLAGEVRALRRRGFRWPERDERAAPNELPHRRFGAQITPAENRREEACSPRMAALELAHHCDALVFGEELLLGNVCLTPDLDLQCRVGAEVADPLGVGPPGRKDDGFAGLRVVRQRHRDRLASLAGLPTFVGD